MSNQKTISWLLFGVLALLWGSSFILMKAGAKNLNGWQIGAIRIASAAAVLLPVAVFSLRKIPASKIPLIILTGFLGNLFPAFLFAIATCNAFVHFTISRRRNCFYKSECDTHE